MSALRDLPQFTTRLSADIIAFSPEEALAQTEIIQDPARWEALERDDRWAAIGRSSASDLWLLGPDGAVWFFDGNYGELATHLFDSLGISITEWLVLAHALNRFEKIEDPTDDDVMRLDMLLESISPDLADRYPLDLPFA